MYGIDPVETLKKAQADLQNLLEETTQLLSVIDDTAICFLSAGPNVPEATATMIDAASEIMVFRNAVLAGRAKLVQRRDALKIREEQLSK